MTVTSQFTQVIMDLEVEAANPIIPCLNPLHYADHTPPIQYAALTEQINQVLLHCLCKLRQTLPSNQSLAYESIVNR